MVVGTAVVFGLLAGVGWGTGPIASKYAFQDGVSPIIAGITQSGIGVIALWCVAILIHGPRTLQQISPSLILPFVVTGVIASAVGRYLLYYGINLVGASINSSLAATDPLFATLIAIVALNEIPTTMELIGCVITVGGVVLVAGSNGGNNSDWKRRGVGIPLIAAGLYGAGAVIRRYGFGEGQIPPVFASAINETTALIALSVGFLITQPNIRDQLNIDQFRYLILTGILYTSGTVSMFAALNAGPVVIGTTLGSTAAVISVIGSKLWLSDSETITPAIVVGSIVTVVGVITLSV